PRHPVHEGGGQEHHHQGQGGGDHRQGDLRHRVGGGLFHRFAHPRVADDVLDLDDGIVHQDPDDQGQGQQGDGVEGESQPVHGGEGGNDRQRQRRGGEQRRPPVPQEEQIGRAHV